jgi:hypothetical protein
LPKFWLSFFCSFRIFLREFSRLAFNTAEKAFTDTQKSTSPVIGCKGKRAMNPFLEIRWRLAFFFLRYEMGSDYEMGGSCRGGSGVLPEQITVLGDLKLKLTAEFDWSRSGRRMKIRRRMGLLLNRRTQGLLASTESY